MATSTGGYKKKRFQYSLLKVKKALKAIEEGMSKSTAARLFKVPRTTLRNKLTNKAPRESTGHCGPHSILGEEIEYMLVDWIINCANMGFPVNKGDLCLSVQKLVKTSGLECPLFIDGLPGKKWYYAFLKRHSVISQKAC